MRCVVLIALLSLVAASEATDAQTPCSCGVQQVGACDGSNCQGCNNCSLISRLRSRCKGVECVPPAYGEPDLFYNFWNGPNCGGVAAQLYIAPHPVPAYVGHTFYTYQPLMPHEMLYTHKRTYHRYYDEGRGLNRTRVVWHKSPGYMASNVVNHLLQAR